jgi:hypothetical protein
MNDSDLDKLLKHSKVPRQSERFWQELTRTISSKIHFSGHRKPATSTTAPPWSMIAWGMSFAAICLIAGFAFPKKANLNLIHAYDPSQNQKLVDEVLGLFPNQVEAILQNQNGVQLVLSEKPNIPSSTPIWIKVCDGASCRSIVTFSGQTVEVDGQQVEVLSDSRQQIMLVGEHFFWSSEDGQSKDHLEINARAMNYPL